LGMEKQTIYLVRGTKRKRIKHWGKCCSKRSLSTSDQILAPTELPRPGSEVAKGPLGGEGVADGKARIPVEACWDTDLDKKL